MIVRSYKIKKRIISIIHILIIIIGLSSSIGYITRNQYCNVLGTFTTSSPDATAAFASVNQIEHYLYKVIIEKYSQGIIIQKLELNSGTDESLPLMKNWINILAVNFGMHFHNEDTVLVQKIFRNAFCNKDADHIRIKLLKEKSNVPNDIIMEVKCTL